VEFNPYSLNHKKSLITIANPSSTKIFITSTSFHLPHLHLSIFTIYVNNTLHISDYVLETSQKQCTMSALLHVLRRIPTDHKLISIFYSDKTFPSYVTYTYKSPFLDISTTITTAFDDLLSDPDLTFTGFWFSKVWAKVRTGEWHQQCKEEATMKMIYELTPLPPSKDRMFLEWHRNQPPF
jgi:hypothetical protein